MFDGILMVTSDLPIGFCLLVRSTSLVLQIPPSSCQELKDKEQELKDKEHRLAALEVGNGWKPLGLG